MVAAFYSAVHCVNAYFWEKKGFDLGAHQNRKAEVQTNPALTPAAAAYLRLDGLAYKARYAATFRISAQDVQDLLNTDLEAVRTAVLSAI